MFRNAKKNNTPTSTQPLHSKMGGIGILGCSSVLWLLNSEKWHVARKALCRTSARKYNWTANKTAHIAA